MRRGSLRRARLEDAPLLNDLARHAYADYVPLIGRRPQPMAVDWATLIDDHEIWIMAPARNGAIASLALKLKPDHVLIWSVAVMPEHQHRGLGRQLLSFAEERAVALGRPEIRLFTNARMTRNLEIYRRLGYDEVEREAREDRVLVHMRKRLKPRNGRRAPTA